MISSLPLFHQITGQPVIVLGAGEAAEAKRRLVERAGGLVIDDIQEGIDKGARLAFVAHDNDDAVQADAIRLRCAGLLVNVVDRPDLCDFTTPSILDRDPVLIAVGTGGASAGLAKALRLRLEALLPQSLGNLANVLKDARESLRKRLPDAGTRRRALDDALAEGGALDLLRGESATEVAKWLEDSSAPASASVHQFTLASQDPDDLTLRQARLLGSADVIAYEPKVPEAVISRCRADSLRIEIAKGEPPPETGGLIVVIRS